MRDYLQSFAGSTFALAAIWVAAGVLFIAWLVIEARGVGFRQLLGWRHVIRRSLRAGFLLALLLPAVLVVIGSFAGPWAVLIIVLGLQYLPPSVYVLCVCLALLVNLVRGAADLAPGAKRAAGVTAIVMAVTGFVMLYVSLVWLDKPV